MQQSTFLAIGITSMSLLQPLYLASIHPEQSFFGHLVGVLEILCSHLHAAIGKIGEPRHPTNVSGRCSYFALSPDFRVPTSNMANIRNKSM